MFQPPFAAPWHRPQEFFGARTQMPHATPVSSSLPPSFLPTGGGAHGPLSMPGADSFQPLANKAPNMAASAQWYANRPPPAAPATPGGPGAGISGPGGPDFTSGINGPIGAPGGLPGPVDGNWQSSGGYASPFGKG